MNILRFILIAAIALVLTANTLANTFPHVDLELTKTVDKEEAFENETVTFNIEVINNGPESQVGNVTVTDQLPAGLAYDSFIATQGSYDWTIGIWNVGSLGFEQSESLDLLAIVDPGTLGQTLNNTATASGDVYDTDPDNNSMTASVEVIPEPATLGMLLLGGLAIFRRRR
jgi:uncharacterized repeat protein (TIGR01451 family)